MHHQRCILLKIKGAFLVRGSTHHALGIIAESKFF